MSIHPSSELVDLMTDSAMATRREMLHKTLMNEGKFVPGHNLIEDDAPGLMRQLWIEKNDGQDKYLLRGKVRLGYNLGSDNESSDIEWASPMDDEEVNLLLDISTQRKLSVQTRPSDFQFSTKNVLEMGEKILIDHLKNEKGDHGSIKIIRRSTELEQESGEKNVWIVAENEWSENLILNLVAEAIEYDDMAKEWGGGIPFKEFANLAFMLENSIYQTDILDNVWILDKVRDKEERDRLLEWLDILKKSGKGSMDGVSWSEKLTRRVENQKSATSNHLNQILQRVGVVDYEFDTDMIELIVKEFEVIGGLDPLKLQSVLYRAIESDSIKNEERVSKRWEIQKSLIRKEMINLRARETIRAAAQQKRLINPESRIAEVMYVNMSFRPQELSPIELTEFFASNWTELNWRDKHPKSLSLSEIKRRLSTYMAKYDKNESKFENNVIITNLQSWLNDEGIPDLMDKMGWRSQLKTIFDLDFQLLVEQDFASTKIYSGMLDQVKSHKVTSKKSRASKVLGETLKRKTLTNALSEQDKILPDMNDVWRLWKRERSRVLQKWVQPGRIGREIALFKKFKSSEKFIALGINDLRFDNPEEMRIFNTASSDLTKAVMRLKSLADDLGMKTSNEIGRFLDELAYQGRITQLYGRYVTYGPVGAEWRERLAARASSGQVGDGDKDSDTLTISAEELSMLGRLSNLRAGESKEMMGDA